MKGEAESKGGEPEAHLKPSDWDVGGIDQDTYKMSGTEAGGHNESS